MTTKPTQGPWHVRIDKSSGTRVITIRGQPNAAGLCRKIAEVNPCVNPFTEGCTAQDVARLIAAAPELLETLLQAGDIIDDALARGALRGQGIKDFTTQLDDLVKQIEGE